MARMNPGPPPPDEMDFNVAMGGGLPWWAALVFMLAVMALVAFGIWLGWR